MRCASALLAVRRLRASRKSSGRREIASSPSAPRNGDYPGLDLRIKSFCKQLREAGAILICLVSLVPWLNRPAAGSPLAWHNDFPSIFIIVLKKSISPEGVDIVDPAPNENRSLSVSYRSEISIANWSPHNFGIPCGSWRDHRCPSTISRMKNRVLSVKNICQSPTSKGIGGCLTKILYCCADFEVVFPGSRDHQFNPPISYEYISAQLPFGMALAGLPKQMSGEPETASKKRGNDCRNSNDPIMPECFEYAGHRYNKHYMWRGTFVVLIIGAIFCGFYYAGWDA